VSGRPLPDGLFNVVRPPDIPTQPNSDPAGPPVEGIGTVAGVTARATCVGETVSIESPGDQMSVTIRIPTTLRTLTGGESQVEVEGATVGEALSSLDSAHPGFADRLFDDEGGLRRFVNVFLADDDVRYLDGVDTLVPEGETISIIPAVAGG
jgi:molybdopterin converting factor small subunit